MEETRKSKGLIITLIIIIAVLLGVIGYFVYDKYLTDNTTVENNTKGDKNTVKGEELSLSNDVVVELEKKLASIHNYCIVYDYFYTGNDVYTSTISNDDKIDSVINYLDLYSSYKDSKLFNNAYYYVLSDETVTNIKETIKDLFGKDQEFNPGTSYTSSSAIIYVDGKYLLAQNGCGFEGNRALSFTDKAIKTDDEIKIYKVVGYYFPTGYNEAAKNKSILTTDKDGNNIIASKTSNKTATDWMTTEWDYFTEQLKNNADQFDSYVFTFKLDSTGNYYFYSSEIVK